MSSTDLPTIVPFQSGYGVSLGLAVVVPIIYYIIASTKGHAGRQRGTRSMSSWAFGFLVHSLACAWYCTVAFNITQGVIWDGTTVPVVPVYAGAVAILVSALANMVFSYYGHADPLANESMDSSDEKTPLNTQAAHPVYSRNHWSSPLGIWATVTYFFYAFPWAFQQNDPTTLWYIFGVSMAGALGYIAAFIRAIVYIYNIPGYASPTQTRHKRYNKIAACMIFVILFFVISAAVPIWNWISPAVATGQPTYTLQNSLIVSLCIPYAAAIVAAAQWIFFDVIKMESTDSSAAKKT